MTELQGEHADEVARRFGYHSPADADDPEVRGRDHELVRNLIGTATGALLEIVPAGRERALMVTKLEESMMWANAGIARQDTPGEPL